MTQGELQRRIDEAYESLPIDWAHQIVPMNFEKKFWRFLRRQRKLSRKQVDI